MRMLLALENREQSDVYDHSPSESIGTRPHAYHWLPV